MPVVKLDKKYLPEIIDNIERNGGDASQLRAILKDSKKDLEPDDIPDEELVELVRKDSPVQVGDGLVCCLCHKETARVTSGVCDECFRPWALSGKKGYLASRRKDGD